MDHAETQSAVIEFLSDRQSFGPPCESVELIQTHGAYVFLAGADAYKVKRSVRYPYLDFSTLQKREIACRRELQVNQPHAPEIYLGVVPITRESNGKLAINGRGKVLEWALHMRRFPAGALLSDFAEDQRITVSLAEAVGRAVARYHRHLSGRASNGAQRVADVIAGLQTFMHALPRSHPSLTDDCDQLCRLLQGQFARVEQRLDARAAQGFVVRGHGDLHLANIAVLNDRPVLFDALEFNEELATVDVLYDLAFLLMDLERAGQRDKANIVLNRYLVDSRHDEHYGGLIAMPLFIGIRAAIRSMVSFQRSALLATAQQQETVALGMHYLRIALSALRPASPRLVAIGGLSGTGKSSQARGIAPGLGCSPGAVHLRSDQERKILANVRETDRLPADAYRQHANRQVYDSLFSKARSCLAAGHSVVLDATFLDPTQRHAAERLARDCAVPFMGIWLSASPDQLRKRVAARQNDASDATEAVVDAQLKRDTGSNAWASVDASNDEANTRAALAQLLDV